jgi:hypothetical protein
MYRLIVENERGEQLELTDNAAYTITNIDGLYPPSAAINLATTANQDGSKFNSSRVNERNIVIELYIEHPCEENRINLYKYIKSKRYIKLYYSNETRNVYIDGYVESIPIEIFATKQKVQISILCAFPFFRTVGDNVIEFSSVNGLFEFPFSIVEEGIEFSSLQLHAEKSIVNAGDVVNGMQIKLYAIGLVLNPKIYNTETKEHFILNFEMAEGDEINISTVTGDKHVTLLHNGVETNIINKLAPGSKWLQLQPGDNVFTYEADEYVENLFCTFIQTTLFEGV